MPSSYLKKISRILTTFILGFFVLNILGASVAEARVGGGRSSGRSSGFGGSRYAPRSPQRYQSYPMAPRREGGSFFRGLAGGLAGGFLGSMLFSSLGHAGGLGGMGSGGLGLLEILLIGALIYFGLRWWRNRQTSRPSYYSQANPVGYDPIQDTRPLGTSDNIGTDEASDIFFKIQGAWTRRDLSSVKDLLGGEMPAILGSDLERLKSNHQINRLENISIRGTEVADGWQENGQDFSTVRFTANLLDYTVDESSGRLIDGSDSLPVKFEEDWTFSKSPGAGRWQLVGIQQV